jgi:hypothetical protein
VWVNPKGKRTDRLPNPFNLILRGLAEGDVLYDGSAEVVVDFGNLPDVPESGGSSAPPAPMRLYMRVSDGYIQYSEDGVLWENVIAVEDLRGDDYNLTDADKTEIAEEAAKQCGRGRIPSVGMPISFSAVLNSVGSYDLALFCYEGDGTTSLKQVLTSHKNAKRIAVIIGAEGGFSLAEAEAAVKAGCESVGLGKRILRCETAPLCVLSDISYEFEL